MRPDALEAKLVSAFCGPISVRAVPQGLAISSAFRDSSGDRIAFYATADDGGFRLEDDGDYLAQLVARDIPIEHGQRGQILDAILNQSNAFWDRDTFEIKTSRLPEAELASQAVEFLSSLIRIRSLELLTRENIKSTFREDVIAELSRKFESTALIEEDVAPSREFSEFVADIVIRPHDHRLRTGALYLVNSNDKLNEALLLQTETQILHDDRIAVVAVIEDADMKTISRRRFQRAQNRSLTMPIFRGDEAAAVATIGRRVLDIAA